MNQTAGLSAWRWLFILEGLPSVVSAFFVFFFLPDYPETARWLTAEEKMLAAERLRMEGSHGQSEGMKWKDAKETLMDWRLYAHYAVYFGISTPFSSLSLFTPTITAGLGYDGLKAQLMTGKYAIRRSISNISADLASSSIRSGICRYRPRVLECRSLQRSWYPQRGICHNWCCWLPGICSLACTCLRLAIWLLNCGGIWSVQLHTASAWLAQLESVQHRFHWFGDCNQYIFWCSRTDCWCLDL